MKTLGINDITHVLSPSSGTVVHAYAALTRELRLDYVRPPTFERGLAP